MRRVEVLIGLAMLLAASAWAVFVMTATAQADGRHRPGSQVDIVSDWSTPQGDGYLGDGFKVVTVDGHTCIAWSRYRGAYEASDSGLSCDWNSR